VRAQEDERQLIAQELQDELVQSMVALCWRLDAVRQTVREGLPEPVTAALAEARKVAEGVTDELSRFARDLRPSVLDDLGLASAVRALVEEISERARLRGRLMVDGVPRRLAPSVEVSLFWIAQEALRNVERHAGATALTVRLKYGRDVRLVVSDDGKGFELAPYSTLTNTGRLGLLGMYGRARLLGGSCRIESQPGEGTGVDVRIPLERTNRRPTASTPKPK
jgi:signal transduction histidine kinase